MGGEVQVFDVWAVVHVHVVAMEAPADDLAWVGLGASTFVMVQCILPQPVLPKLEVRHSLS
jgi:hypothetical protein